MIIAKWLTQYLTKKVHHFANCRHAFYLAGSLSVALFITCFWNSSFADSTSHAKVQAKPQPNAQKFTFPSAQIGKLYVLPADWDVTKKRNDDKYLAVAKGIVLVPSGVPLSLKLDYALIEQPQLLKVPACNVVQVFGDLIGFEDSICKPISEIASVIRVDLSSSEITDAGVAQLCNNKKLQALAIEKTVLTGSCLHAMKDVNLLYLDIGQNVIGPQYYKDFAGLSHVVRARFNSNGLTDASLSSIAKMRSLIDLQLRGNPKLTDEGFKLLFSCKKLEYLNLRDTNIKLKGVEDILNNLHLKLLIVDEQVLNNPTGKRLMTKFPGVLNAHAGYNTEEVQKLYAPLK